MITRLSASALAPLAAPVILLLAILLFPVAGSLTFIDTPPLNLSLPVNVSQWKLVKVLFCQNDQCLKSIEYEDDRPQRCPACGGILDAVPLGEKLALPPDTLIVHGRYKDATDRQIDIAIVVSGNSRSSFHKPELCLAGQGYRIIGRSKLSSSPADKKAFLMQLYYVQKSLSTASEGKTTQTALFAYWFIGPKVQTASPLLRSWYMSKDRIFEGKAYRWAYLSITMPYIVHRENSPKILADFAGSLQQRLARD